jgi:hypothetical protein
MANEMTSTTLASIINSEAIMEARLAFQQNANLPAVVRVADLTGMPTKAASFPIFTQASVSKTAEGTDQTTNTTCDPADVALTVARRVIKLTPTDLGIAASQENMSVRLGQAIGNARAKQVDTDILGVMTTNYTYSVGATNSTDISVANILSALLTLEIAEANENLILALHPNQWNHLRGDLVLVSATSTATERGTDYSDQGRQILTSGKLFLPLFGAMLIVTPRVNTGTATNDIYKGALFNAESIGYAVKNVSAEMGISDIELQRDASLGATEYVHNYYDSCGIIRATGIVLVKSQTY